MTCPICTSDVHVLDSLHTDRRKGTAGAWEYHKCNGCGLLFLFPQPSENELKEFYRNYSKAHEVRVERNSGIVLRSLRRLLHLLRGDVDPRDFIPVSRNMRVLDFGSGDSGYLADFHARGAHISGAEVATHLVDASRARGFDVVKVDKLERIPFGDAVFDIVYLMQVFEHLANPDAFMLEAARVLKPRGELYLAMPNSKSGWRGVFGKNWVSGWFAPFHLFQYDRGAISRLATSHGFCAVASWSRTPESWFRLNLKAFCYPAENRLDQRKTRLDALPVRCALIFLLRVLELVMRERDCLVMRLRKLT